MKKEYIILDQEHKASGLLRLAICLDFPSLDEVMPFSRLRSSDATRNCPSSSEFDFQYFERQLPTKQIFPVAVLEDIEIDYEKRRRGLGRTAIRAFCAIAEDHHSALCLLRVGTASIDEGDSGLDWRRRFYESESWVCFKTPPIPELVLVLMYHLILPSRESSRRAARSFLVEKPEQAPPFLFPS